MQSLLPFLALISARLTWASLVKDGSDHPDRMWGVPGYPHIPPSPWYSGFLEYEIVPGTKIHTHYVFVEAETTNGKDPADVPLIYWSNGGPGASSLFGLLTELGPLLFSDLSLQTTTYKETGIPTPLYNKDSWTQLGSVLVFDAPAPVGFSYCNDTMAGEGFSCLSWTDELASLNTYTALKTFFTEKFPELRQQPLYLTGESYAGIYIPTLARRVLEGQDEFHMNLQGFAVGDGCLGTNTTVCGDELGSDNWKNTYFHVLFLAGHGQMPYSMFQDIMEACDAERKTMRSSASSSSTITNDDDDVSPGCKKLLDTAREAVGGFYDYSLYDDCTYNNGILLQSNLEHFDTDFLNTNHLDDGALNDYACGGGPVMDRYMTLTAVKEGFHIPSGDLFYSVDNAVSFDYTPTEPDLRGFYTDVAKGKYGDVRVIVYNGDTDPAITSFATQDWTSKLGLEEVEAWRPWTIDGCRRMGGYVTRYEGSFDFLTIRGAGHMVPTYKPDATFAFIKAWIENEDYLAFDKKCTAPTTTNGKQPVVGGEVAIEA